MLQTLCTFCREQEYVDVGKAGLDQKLYPCHGPQENSGLLSYLGDLCKWRKPQWVEQFTLVSAFLWPAQKDNAKGACLQAGVHVFDTCELEFGCVQPWKSCSVLHCAL